MREESGHERFRRPAAERRDYAQPASDNETPWLSDDEAVDESSNGPRMVEPVPLGYAPETEQDQVERQPSLLDRLLGRTQRRARLNDLNFAIASYPDSPTNYVLRGELHLAAGNIEAAAADFQTALSLADSEFAQSDWGLVAQSARDRALLGLRRVGRR